MPFKLMQWRGTVPSGLNVRQTCSSFDIFATAQANAKVLRHRIRSRRRLNPFVTGETPVSRNENALLATGWQDCDTPGDLEVGFRMEVEDSPANAKWELCNLVDDLSKQSTSPNRTPRLNRIWWNCGKSEGEWRATILVTKRQRMNKTR